MTIDVNTCPMIITSTSHLLNFSLASSFISMGYILSVCRCAFNGVFSQKFLKFIVD